MIFLEQSDGFEYIAENKIYSTLREKCSNKELFLVRIFPHSDCTKYLSVFSSNARKYGPEITTNSDTFRAVLNACKGSRGDNFVVKFVIFYKEFYLDIFCYFYTFYIFKFT